MRSVETVKRAAEEAGRDPASVKVWSCFATVGDHIDEPLRLKKTVGRLATYLQGYGDLMVKTNEWDPAVLERFRADEVVIFRERLSGRSVPSEPGATLAALADTEASPAHAPALAQRRLETLLAAFKEAGVPSAAGRVAARRAPGFDGGRH